MGHPMAGSANRSHSGRHQHSVAQSSKLYDLLGLSRDASAADIRRAYKRLAKIHHPDKGGDPEKFKELTHALEVLSDTEKRVRYDRWGDVDQTSPECSNQFSGFLDPRNLHRPAKKTEDVVHDVNVTLEQLFTGQTVKVAVEREVIDKAKAIGSCSECGGAGVRVQMTRAGGIDQPMQVTCQTCTGRGQIFELKKQREELEVHIRKGAPNEHRVVFPGKANERPGSETGQAIFVLKQQEHRDFKRKGADLFVERKISLVEALCGLELELTHLDGRKLLVKTSPGELVRPLARGFDPLAGSDGKLEWEVFEDCDCESIDDVAQADTVEAETAKNLCETRLKDQGHVIGAFVIQDGKAHFKQAQREEVLAAKRPREGAILYVQADPLASSKRHLIKAVRGAGMPTLKNPLLRGNLFLLLDIEFPDSLSLESQSKIREWLPPPLHNPTITDECFEVCDLQDIDPVQSYNSNKANMATGAEACDDEEGIHLCGGKTPPGNEQVQCAQQ